jgi:hypothetical protein
MTSNEDLQLSINANEHTPRSLQRGKKEDVDVRRPFIV